MFKMSYGPVLESLPLSAVGRFWFWWAGLAWHWLNAKANLTIGTKILVNIAKNAKPSLPIQNLPIMILPVNAKPQESAHQEPAH